jgi:predicted DNA-binding transcriptional regulator AlpA
VTAAWLEELTASPVIRPRRWAEISGIAPSTVYDAVKRGDLPSIHLGSAVFIPTEPLRKLLGLEVGE